MKAPARRSELSGPLNGRPPAQLLRPALQVRQAFAGLRYRTFRARVARVKRQVGDRQLGSRTVLALAEIVVPHLEVAAHAAAEQVRGRAVRVLGADHGEQRAEHRRDVGRGAHQRLQRRRARCRIARQEPARLLRAIHQDRGRLRQRQRLAARAFAVDEHRDLPHRVHGEKPGRLLLALLDVDRMKVVGEAAFLDGDARTHAVRRAGGIKIDHGLLRKKMMVLRIRPLRQACAFAVSTLSSASPKRLKASGSSSSVKIVALTMPPTITTANGRWVSEPMPCDSAAGNKPSPAIRAVIRIGRRRSTAPSTTALSSGLPRRTKSTICSTMITPFCTEIPATAMKPTAAETERCRPAIASPATPPTNVKGTIISTMAAMRSRAIARCWFSNCPPQVME